MRNMANGKCMDVAGSEGSGDVNVWDCGDGAAAADQRWMLGNFDDEGYFSIINKKSGECLDVAWNDGDGTTMTWACLDSATDMKWKWEEED